MVTTKKVIFYFVTFTYTDTFRNIQLNNYVLWRTVFSGLLSLLSLFENLIYVVILI